MHSVITEEKNPFDATIEEGRGESEKMVRGKLTCVAMAITVTAKCRSGVRCGSLSVFLKTAGLLRFLNVSCVKKLGAAVREEEDVFECINNCMDFASTKTSVEMPLQWGRGFGVANGKCWSGVATHIIGKTVLVCMCVIMRGLNIEKWWDLMRVLDKWR